MVARLFRISSPFHRQAESDEEHIEIMDAVMRRDVASAQAAMRRHLRNLQDDAHREIESEAYLSPRNKEMK
jgi:DNA-binding GntR family transcriptional regulator